VKKKRIYSLIFINALLVVTGIAVSQYYLTQDSLEGIKYIPTLLLFVLLIYICLQLVKRVFLKYRNWWDWLYYVSLISTILPMFFENLFTVPTFLRITWLGSLFLMFPPVLDGINLIKNER